jgi:PPOX class probable F420-dependent enzyme
MTAKDMSKGLAAVAMSKEEIKEFLSVPRLARMATVHDGKPHIVPIWYYYDGEAMMVTTPKGTKKIRNLEKNPHVSIIVDVSDGKAGELSFYTDAKAVIIEGKVEMREDPDNSFARKVYARYVSESNLNNQMVQFTINVPRYTLVIKPEKVTSWDFTKIGRMQR